ncbi:MULTISPECIES: response regulator [unclassified Nostoc]|uniref:response regulator n=1 Tax=unclassified Nostoc TaxID=2593658 RepID=UPI002AD4EB39|nr:response regulator [Nostoc sp. ChiQUE02]MDZ8233522.1 response regulator [Nostoc sp. ChiQUE02]
MSSYTNRCILVIDDEPDLCSIVKLTLEHLKSWKILTAESVQAGLIQAKMHQPDVILLDLNLYGEDGLTMLQSLKTNPTTESIPVILFTATDLSSDLLEFDSSDFAGVILKPFNVLQLGEQIIEQLGW